MNLPNNGFTSLHLSLPVNVTLEETGGIESSGALSLSNSGSSKAWSSSFSTTVGTAMYCPELGAEEDENALEGGRRNMNVIGVMKGSI